MMLENDSESCRQSFIKEEVISLIKEHTKELNETGKIKVSGFSLDHIICSFLLDLKDDKSEKSYYCKYLSNQSEDTFQQFFHFLFLLKDKEEVLNKLTTIELLNHSFLTKFKFNDVEIVKQRGKNVRRISYQSPIIRNSSMRMTITLNEDNSIMFSEIFFNTYRKCKKGKQPFLTSQFILNTYQIFNSTQIVLKDSSHKFLNSFEVFGYLLPCSLDKVIKSVIESQIPKFSLHSFYKVEQIIKIEEELSSLYNIVLEKIPFQENCILTKKKD